MLVVMSFCIASFPPSRLSSLRHILSQGWGCLLQAFFQTSGGFRMEEEERGCVRVRLVSGWRGALGIGGEEHTGCTPPAGGEEEQQQPVEAVPSQPSHPEHNLD